jgi:hypothetical protein
MTKDYYLATNAWYWVIQVIWVIYMMGIPCYIVLILNTEVVDTLFRIDLPYGTYFSMRYTSFWWVVMFMSGFKLFTAIIWPLATLFRLSKGCSIMWLVFMFLFFSSGVFVFIGQSVIFGKCNQNGQVDNPCNSRTWCCVPEIYMNAENLCNQGPYPCPCPDDITNVLNCPVYPTSISQLNPDVDFLWIYFVNLFYTIVDAGMFGFYIYSFFDAFVLNSSSSVKSSKKNE